MAKEERDPLTPPTSSRRSSSAPAKPVRTPVRKPHYVRLKNRLSQALTFSVLSTNGRDVEEQRLAPRATSGPIAEDRLNEYTRGLIQRGHLAVV
jgi:hypothetical protein